ncbi:shikimate dehydrogenase [Rhodobacter capsulatus]|jgi:shikimate dehydrogenase|uniref:shikimate dehydrogenase n=1 Tax=Rhodobacter capsulatus TaxID=1061 RepID=UPI0003D356D9|nr:shikimate dehydrogenase [Rhodobacter capsulatus]ETD03547.1 shikimate 5-dehydrogenase [Rhodobacter capsulatus DE442]ETD80340.1 shikimate 5-dehydrogenase [Rhodobacter capsulatus R121]ETE55607.1 shikimate 5-dehydrogenase [Rhodobacter capsulatus Y262]MDS0925424.1 shikimate dehydrogenase [Rhodobacter capsulatus]TQD36685.1 shikimate dehydrogenase [Rhodobacter capsulatus]
MTRIPLAGVIGHPIHHSRSPALHGHWLKTYGIRGHYIPMDVAEGDLEAVLRTLPKAGFVGCNITIPHKETALALADVVSDRAARIGAANTLVFDETGRIHADNTDGIGFLANLIEGAPGWQAKAGPAAVIGAGGAARAIVVALLEAGCPEIRISNRTRTRAEVLCAEFGPRVVVQDWEKVGMIFDGAATVVNTSSLGMAGKAAFDLTLDALSPTAVVTDCVYTPLRTDFLTAAAARGCVTVDGLGMLLHQAVPGFERWFGRRPEVTPELRAVVLAA